MDYCNINASELTYAAKTLSQEQRQCICSQLKEYIAQMRALNAPKAGHRRLEAADGSGLFDIRLARVHSLHFLLWRSFMCALGMDSSSNLQITVICGRTSSSSHNGGITQYLHIQIIAPRNILIKDGKVACSLQAIIGWESAGWYPEYWEYTRWAVSNYSSRRIGQDLRDDVLEPYPNELRVDEYLDTVFTRL